MLTILPASAASLADLRAHSSGSLYHDPATECVHVRG